MAFSYRTQRSGLHGAPHADGTQQQQHQRRLTPHPISSLLATITITTTTTKTICSYNNYTIDQP